MKEIESREKILFHDVMLSALKSGMPGIILKLENGEMVADIITPDSKDILDAMIVSMEIDHE